MKSTTSTSSAGPAPTQSPWLAVASLVAGILGLLGSVVVLGGLLALGGLVFGILHLRKRTDARVMGWSGVWVSALAMVASAGFAAFYAVALPRIAMQMEHGPGSGSPMGFARWVGQAAPELEVRTLDGGQLKLSDLKGRRVVLDFWATWCGPCVMEIPHLSQLQSESGTDGLVIVGLSQEDRAVLKKFADARGLSYPIASLADVELAAPYSDVRAIPTKFFLDEAGVIRHVAVGYLEFEALKANALGSGRASAPVVE